MWTLYLVLLLAFVFPSWRWDAHAGLLAWWLLALAVWPARVCQEPVLIRSRKLLLWAEELREGAEGIWAVIPAVLRLEYWVGSQMWRSFFKEASPNYPVLKAAVRVSIGQLLSLLCCDAWVWKHTVKRWWGVGRDLLVVWDCGAS